MIREVLIQAQQIGMMSEEYYYLLTSIDAHTVDLHRFKVKSRGKKYRWKKNNVLKRKSELLLLALKKDSLLI